MGGVGGPIDDVSDIRGGPKERSVSPAPLRRFIKKVCPDKPQTEVTSVTLQPLFPSGLSGPRVQHIAMLAVFSTGGLTCRQYLAF